MAMVSKNSCQMQTNPKLSLVSSITLLLQTLNPQSPTISNLSSAPLNHFSPQLNPNLVIQVIKNQTNPYHALFFFNWASNPNPNPNNYFHTHHCYLAITDLLLSHSLFSTASSLLLNSHKLSDFMLGKVIKAFGDRGNIRSAIYWFHQAKLIENGHCLFSYNAILGVLVRANRINLAKAFYDQIVKEGVVKPDVSTYTTMIRGFCKMGMIKNAKKVFDEMSCGPNLITYNTMINGFSKRMMTKMRLNGLKDNVATHTSILKGLCIVGNSDEAVKHLKEMVSLGMKVDVQAYGVVVNEYCKMRKPNEAISLLKEMNARCLNPSVSSFNAVFRVLVENGELEKAVLLLKQMPQMGCSPNFLSYSRIICSLCRMRGKMQEVEEVVSDLLQNGHDIDATMYNCLIKGYCEDGNEQMAMRVFYETIEKKYVISVESFSIFVKELCAKGKVIEATMVFEEMCRRCYVLDVSSYKRLLDEQLGLYVDNQHRSMPLGHNEYSREKLTALSTDSKKELIGTGTCHSLSCTI
ncbi:hypothetical protein CMV_018229 [Castanea mollissima]|uniref:Pentatricopeptide repeat-containing protein n=1 Tax=Castanea mollissima TaxID=60419 RepID=A0A8J4R4X2_9ROSI|nr:hypothetical protein CMV_018229 [Castanea mollissima]